MKTKCLFPGSFNPFTAGHANIVERALKMFDEVYIGVCQNPEKTETSLESLCSQIKSVYSNNDRVKVVSYDRLTGDICREMGINAIIRGVRNNKDLQYENEITAFNFSIFGVETIYLLADPKLKELSSTMVRELKSRGFEIPSEYIAQSK